MRQLRIILLSLTLAGFLAAASFPVPYADGHAGATPEQTTESTAKAEEGEHGLTAGANEIFSIPLGPLGRFPVTNSMFVTWIVAAVIILFARIATRRMKEVPD